MEWGGVVAGGASGARGKSGQQGRVEDEVEKQTGAIGNDQRDRLLEVGLSECDRACRRY
jgi:hypothetical protein